MTVGWLIDAGVFDAYHDELAAAVSRNGHKVVSLNRPNPPYEWDDTGCSYRKAFPAGSCVITHADIDLVTRVIDDQRWTPGAFATVDHFFCSHYYAHLGRFLLNCDYVMLPFAELPRCHEFLFDTLGRDDRLATEGSKLAKRLASSGAARGAIVCKLREIGIDGRYAVKS
jgi:hypothetical protein